MLKRIVQLGALIALALSALAQPPISSKNFSNDVKAISSGIGSVERGEVIRAELAKLRIRVSTESFIRNGKTPNEVSGTNIIAELPGKDAKRVVMIGAHYDKVTIGSGAVDNASGSAAVLQLLRAFKERPLKNIRLQAAFWDAEEKGLVGSKMYVDGRKGAGLPNFYINFDVFGYGDTLWLWSSDPELEFAKGFIAVASKSADAFKVSSIYPPSDHKSFSVPGVESYSFSLVTGNEVNGVMKLLSGEKVEQVDTPKIMQTIHTANDTVEKIDAAAVVKALQVVEAAIRTLDK